jgi:hypothetical protein
MCVNNLLEQCRPGSLSRCSVSLGRYACANEQVWGLQRVRWHRLPHCSNHADEAIEVLNCFVFGDRKLRVDLGYLV